MITYIDADAVWSHTMIPSVAETGLDLYHEAVGDWCAVATKLGCAHQVSYLETGAEVKVYQQKCTLQDEDMNELFYDFLTNMFDVSLEYAATGGRGCEFSVRLKLEPRKL